MKLSMVTWSCFDGWSFMIDAASGFLFKMVIILQYVKTMNVSPSQTACVSSLLGAGRSSDSPTIVAPDKAADSVVAFDEYIKTSVMPLALTCDELGGLQDIGKHLMDAWDGIRGIIVLASKSKAPEEDLAKALTPHLAQTQDSIKAIQSIKVDRDWDRHFKAISEMLPCNSWVLCKAPSMMPANCAKDAIGAAEFWTNKIRKDFKDDEAQQDFCNNVKKVLKELAEYIEKYHKTGLTWNPKGVSLAEAAVVLAEPPEEKKDVMKSPIGKRRSVGIGGALVGGNMAGLVSELAAKRSADGSSAATGLRKVNDAHGHATASVVNLLLDVNADLSTVVEQKFVGHQRPANMAKGIQQRCCQACCCATQAEGQASGRKEKAHWFAYL